jgi:hypothetical protein
MSEDRYVRFESGVYWTATQMLRWRKNDETPLGYVEVMPTLEQLWQGSNGQQEWRRVPIVEQDGIEANPVGR